MNIDRIKDAIDEMEELFKYINQIPISQMGRIFVTRRDKINMQITIRNFSKIFKGCNDSIYKNMDLAEYNLFVIYGSDYYIDNVWLGYLYAAVDFCKYPSQDKLKKSKIFISHSSKDIEYVTAFVDMLELFGIRDEHLFCSSIDGYKVPLGKNIYDFLQEQFDVYNLYVILMLSDNYYISYACLNEMGAAWALKAEYQAILLPKFDFKNIEGAIDPRSISFRLDDERDRQSRLTELKDKIVKMFDFNYFDNVKWERHKSDFFKKVDKITIDIKT